MNLLAMCYPFQFFTNYLANNRLVERFFAFPKVFPKSFIDHCLITVTGLIGAFAEILKDIRVKVHVLYGRKTMLTRSKSQITTDVGRRLPRNRPPTHPGEMLFEEFVKPLDLTQAELARRLGVSYPRLNEIIKGRRSITPDTALRLSRVLGMSADFWLGLQQDWDFWHAMNSPEAKQIKRLKPIPRDQHSFA